MLLALNKKNDISKRILNHVSQSKIVNLFDKEFDKSDYLKQWSYMRMSVNVNPMEYKYDMFGKLVRKNAYGKLKDKYGWVLIEKKNKQHNQILPVHISNLKKLRNENYIILNLEV